MNSWTAFDEFSIRNSENLTNSSIGWTKVNSVNSPNLRTLWNVLKSSKSRKGCLLCLHEYTHTFFPMVLTLFAAHIVRFFSGVWPLAPKEGKFCVCDSTVALNGLQSYLASVQSWMSMDKLKLYPDKTEYLLLGQNSSTLNTSLCSLLSFSYSPSKICWES